MFVYNEKYVSKKEGFYYSCPWIEHGLVFFQYKLTNCCHCGHSGGGHSMICNNFIGKKIDWDRIFKVKDMYRRFHKKGKINLSCVGCNFLKEDAWDNDRYINHLYISHWTNCNSKCIYCYATQHPECFKIDKMYSVLPYLKEMFEIGLLKRDSEISFGGGEPTLLDEFEDILQFLMDNYFVRCRIHTSGVKYSSVLAEAINSLLAYVVVSLDAGNSETFQKIKQINCYDKVRENIRKYALKTIFSGRDLVSSKFIIIPGINDTKEEINNWLISNKKDGLYAAVLDIEEFWYIKNKDNIPSHIFDLIKYAQKRAKQLNMFFQLYERLQNMFSDVKNKQNKFSYPIVKEK